MKWLEAGRAAMQEERCVGEKEWRKMTDLSLKKSNLSFREADWRMEERKLARQLMAWLRRSKERHGSTAEPKNKEKNGRRGSPSGQPQKRELSGD
jgi:hypothetical protein